MLQPALYLIPCPIGDVPTDFVLPAYNRQVILGIRHFIVEQERTARRFLKRVDAAIDINALTFYPMGKHADAALFSSYLAPLRAGLPVGVVSEAGCPAVADPGALIVAAAQREGLPVVPLVGPSSMILGLMASGLNGQSFAFNGYLPVPPAERRSRLKQLEARALAEGQTQMFIETPYRNARLIDDLLATLRPATRLCIAAGLTTPQAFVRTLPCAQWRHTPRPDLSKTPALFLFGR